MERIKHISQLDDTGCGIACIAMIAKKSYNQVKDELLKQNVISQEDETYHANFSKLNKFAIALGISLKSRRKASKWADIPETSIVSTNYGKKNWHWVVFVKNNHGWYVYDPNEGGLKLRNMKGKSLRWYMALDKPTPSPPSPSSSYSP